MKNVQPEVLSDIFTLNGFDYTRQQIAEEVNSHHETDLNKRDVGEIVNEYEQKSDSLTLRQKRDLMIFQIHGRAMGAALGSSMGLDIDY